MTTNQRVYILGAGAVGLPLAAYLAQAGRAVVLVRTSRNDVPPGTITVTLHNGATRISSVVQSVSLSHLEHLDGLLVIAAKAYANAAIAHQLTAKAARGPLVLLQNGVGVEQPFVQAGFAQIYRCVVYVTSQPRAENEIVFRPVSASPIGIVRGDEAGLVECVSALSTEAFPFRAEAAIEREVWKKAIINTVFNSICPLLDVDNGVFVRNAEAVELARQVVSECVTLTDRLALGLSAGEIEEQLLAISARSDGQLISTLQDLRGGRPTEIAFLNGAIADRAAALHPPLALPRTALLGQLIAAKSAEQRKIHGDCTSSQTTSI